MRQDEEFAPLRIVKKNVMDFDRCAYRVYKSPMEYVTVEAATALEALRESGIQNPLRIVRETRFMERLLDGNRFTDMEELIETGVVMEAPQTITGHREAVPQAARQIPDAEQAQAEVEESPLPQEAQAFMDEDTGALVAEAVEDGLSPDDVAALLGNQETNG